VTLCVMRVKERTRSTILLKCTSTLHSSTLGYRGELGMGSKSWHWCIFDADNRTQRKHQSCSIRPDDWDPRLTERTIIARVRRFNARPGVVGGTLPHSESPSECPYGQTTQLMSTQVFPLAEQNVSSKERCGFTEQRKPEMEMWTTG
jgi:hypothetical protein